MKPHNHVLILALSFGFAVGCAKSTDQNSVPPAAGSTVDTSEKTIVTSDQKTETKAKLLAMFETDPTLVFKTPDETWSKDRLADHEHNLTLLEEALNESPEGSERYTKATSPEIKALFEKQHRLVGIYQAEGTDRSKLQRDEEFIEIFEAQESAK